MEPTAQVASRKLFELRQKLKSLQSELDQWQLRSRAGGPLEKHNTQIRRVTDQLGSLQEFIGLRLDAIAGDAPGIISRAREAERVMLELHRVWDFFRSKFALRSVEWFSPYLLAADEFAWACYDAARKKLSRGLLSEEAIKAPPLVFFNGSVSPFTLPRDSSYEPEHVEDEKVTTAELRDVLRSLPIPVIGIPWLQIRHLPDALSIAHEVGHIIESDFGLTRTLESLLGRGMNQPAGAVSPDRQGAWRAWLGEIFADIYGCLSAGPAYVGILADFLIASQGDIAAETRQPPHWNDYPTGHLRVQLNVEVLRQLSFKEEAAWLKESWLSVYPCHALPEFEQDIPHVVRALLSGTYPECGGLTLAQGIAFSQRQQASALSDARRMLERYKPESEDVRTLFASARLAFEAEPERYITAEVQERVLQRVPLIQQQGYRGGSQEAVVLEERIERYDKAAGPKLYEAILRGLPRRKEAGSVP